MEREEMATATTSASCADLSGFQRDLLAVLALDGKGYGLGLRDRLEAVRGEDIIAGRLYTNLNELAEMGLVEKSERDGRSNEYALTTDGKGELRMYQRWLTHSLEANDA